MKFKTGQRVRFSATASFDEASRGLENAISTIVGPGICGYSYQLDLVGSNGMPVYAMESALTAVDDGDFERFMEGVLKPVDLGEPVTA